MRACPPLLLHPGMGRAAGRGFTLIELLVTIGVMAILAALGAPALTGFIASQRNRSMATDLSIALTKARSEAVKQNTSVTLSPLNSSMVEAQAQMKPAAQDLDAFPMGIDTTCTNNITARRR